MPSPLLFRQVTKKFGSRRALNGIEIEIPAGRIAGLLGRNGAGKSTLLHLACGLILPTSGDCLTLGRPCAELDALELNQLGFVSQTGRFLEWMTVAQQLEFSASFYARWDKAREQQLLEQFELDPSRKIIQLSQGDQQKLGILLGVCHHPTLLLLDEPVSALDPTIRARFLSLLVDLVRDDGATIVISSHLLSDVEKIIDWVVCLDRGEVKVNMPFDELQESYAEWRVSSPAGRLPPQFPEPWILGAEGDSHQARLFVRVPPPDAQQAFSTALAAEIASHPLNLDQLFPLLIRERRVAA